MGFAENLRQLRREKGLSQEDLAERLNVSRQSVSKWEQGVGYPETPTLVLLARELEVSLDRLMDREAPAQQPLYSGRITVVSPWENVIVSCTKVVSSQMFRTGSDGPKYALFGTGSPSLLGENNTFLAWYAREEDLRREIAAIQAALTAGTPTYTLQYSAKTKRRGLRIRLVQD